MRRTLTQLVLFLAPSAINAQIAASADRCNELRQKVTAATEELAAATAAGRDLKRATLMESLRREALRYHSLLIHMGAEGANPTVLLFVDEAPSAAKMRDFAAQAGLPGDVRALIAANRPAEFWRRAEQETRRQYDEEMQRPVTREQAARIQDARQQGLIAWDAFLSAGCTNQSPESPAPALPTRPEGPLTIPRHPPGDRSWAETPIITDAVITRWAAAHRAAAAGGGAPWQVGRMTQLDYQAITGRMLAFSSLACLQNREGDVIRVTCRVTAENRVSLERYYTPEEITAMTARQDDLGTALSTRGN